MTPEEFVDGCLELLGPMQVDDDTKLELVTHAETEGVVTRGSSEEERRVFGQRVVQMLQLIAATREYQFC